MILDDKKTFFFWKGRVALYAILKSMGVGKGDEIILPGFTCVVVPNAVVYHGAKPIYVDIDERTYNISPDKIEERITDRTKVIIAQHTFGIPADMDDILRIARRYNVYVIEDSCHAIGSRYKGKEVGTFGDASFFSSQWSKPFTTGLGGWAAINNDYLLQNMNTLYQEFLSPSYKEQLQLRMQYLIYSGLLKPSLYWFAQNTYRTFSRYGIAIGSSSNEELECRMPAGYEKKMAPWQYNLLREKVMEIEKILSHRRWVSSLYDNALDGKGMKTFDLSECCEPVFLRYPCIVDNKNAVLQEARKRNIELGDWFLSPLHPISSGWGKVYYRKGMCPNAEKMSRHVINLPTHQGIGNKEIEKVLEFLN